MIQYLFSLSSAFDVVTKVSVLLFFVWLGALLARRRSAAAQHRWWTLGFIGCLLIPAVTTTPTWTLPLVSSATSFTQAAPVRGTLPRSEVLPANAAVRAPTNPTTDAPTASTTHMSPLSETRRFVARNDPKQGASERHVTDASHAHGAAAPTRTKADVSPTSLPWTKSIAILWLVGVIGFWSRTVWQHLLLKRMLRTCDPFEDSDWNRMLATCTQQLRLNRTVQLLGHQSAQSPLNAGVWHPVVILPDDAKSWTPDRQRCVLLHELAHVSRRDVLTQVVAGFVCGLYWFNPLCWYGLFQMRKLRELACDDLVLSCGQQPSGYANVLLDIARSYRHKSYFTAVGMARGTNVENRIMAILDKTRRHVSLSRRAAHLLLFAAIALVGVVGTAQLQTQAATPPLTEQPQDDTSQESDNKPSQLPNVADGASDTATDTDTRTGDAGVDSAKQQPPLREMRIHILDDQGAPLEGAKLTVSAWYPEGYEGPRTPKEYTADAQGSVLLQLPKRLNILRLWPSYPGRVRQFKNFARGTHREGELIPDDLEFRLARGHKIGGHIVDALGNPVEGVHVRARYEGNEPAWAIDTVPIVSTWLTDSFGQPTVKTDEQGRWQLDNVPAMSSDEDDYAIRLKLSHPDYITDEHWGDTQRAQGVNMTRLRTGNAMIALQSGAYIGGAVTDLEGKPIAKGWVVWSDTPYFFDGNWEATIDSQGRFRTPPLSVGEHPITIVAPGYAAQRRVVRVGSKAIDLQFSLQPGKRIEIRCVDTAGNPVSEARVYLANTSAPNTWNNSNALHNHKHSNVPDYGIPRKPDENGVFVWDWAPVEPVRYGIGAKGFAYQTVSLVAQDDPHIVTMSEPRVAAGLVTDKETSAPIEKFQVIPVADFRPNFHSTQYTGAEQGVAGRYELPLTNMDYHGRVRFEAEGYRSIVSDQSFSPTAGRVELNVQLEPAPARQGLAIDANGTPVEGAVVIVGTPTWVPNTRNGEPGSNGERIVTTDSDGRFELAATSEPIRVRILHDAGVVEKRVAAEEDTIGTLQLQPWASVSGRLVQDGKPVGSQSVYFFPLVQRELGEARFQDSYYATTSPDGEFSFERLPPGAGSVRASLGVWEDSPLTSSENFALELQPGENREIVLGGDGAVLIGQVIATGRDDVPLDRNWSLNYLVSRERGVRTRDFPALCFDPSTPMQPSWSLDPHFNDWIATRENHFVKLTPEGELRVTGVAPGEYDLVIHLYEQPAGCLVETVGEKIVPVRVEGGGQIDLGRIEVPCRAGPRMGSDMRAYEFVDARGRQVFVSDMNGRYVVMHVWASWCAPCRESMPDILKTMDESSAKPVTFVGLNVDQDSTKARQLAKEHRWNWAQNFLGDKSEMSRQLAISTVPTYFLIGPEGELVASSSEWTKIKNKLLTLLDSASDSPPQRLNQ